VIVDIHTHLFPPEIARDRERFVREDPTFAELYGSVEAKLASAEDLLSSMDASGVDVSVALGFAWGDLETCRLHNDYLIAAAKESNGRIVAFATLPLGAGAAAIEAEVRRCAAGGVRGFGELRPDNVGVDLGGEGGDALARVAEELDAVLSFHVSEPAGHAYPGKEGGSLRGFYGFIRAHAGVKVIGAHWAGGLPFYATMPEVKDAMVNTRVDTAATSLLYDETIYGRVTKLTGAESVLFGSDYPLLSQSRSRRRIEEAGLDDATRDLVLGGNAAALLGLT
jgi:uncharacterized protein